MILARRDMVICGSLFALATALFLPFLGSVHLFDWDEINFAEISREMLITRDFFRIHIDFQPFWEKPPLFFWLQSASMNLFGVNEFAARFPNALLGILTLPLLYLLGKHLFTPAFGLLWALSYVGSFLPHFYFKSGIIDPWFNFFIVCSLVCLAHYYAPVRGKDHSLRFVLASGICIGLAVLTKGPVAYLLMILVWSGFYLVRRARVGFPLKEVLVFTATVLVVSLCWYGVELMQNGFGFFREFLNYQLRLLTTGDSGHKQPLYYHFLVLLIGCFPASALMFAAFRPRTEDSHAQKTFKLLMILLLCVVLIVFTIVQTKIVHYSSLAYFPITFFAAYTIYGTLQRSEYLSRTTQGLVYGLGGVWVLLLGAVPFIALNKDWVIARTRDAFVRGNLQANVLWSGFELTIAGSFALVLLVVILLGAGKRWFEMSTLLFTASTVVMFFFLVIIAPKIEGYTQRAAIEFYESLQGKQCYIKVLGFKSYADLFYSRKQPFQSPSALNIPAEDFQQWLLEGAIDKPAYFVCKINDADEWRTKPTLTELYTRNGFVFFKRDVRK